MICFDKGSIRFRYRVAGVAIYQEMILLHRFEDEISGFYPAVGHNCKKRHQ